MNAPWRKAHHGVMLADGRTAQGFVCEITLLAGAADITALGGWRAYFATRRAEK